MASTTVTAKTVVVADDTAFVRDRFGPRSRTPGTRRSSSRARRNCSPASRPTSRASICSCSTCGCRTRRASIWSASIRKLDDGRLPILIFSGTIASADEVRALAALGVAGYINEYSAAAAHPAVAGAAPVPRQLQPPRQSARDARDPGAVPVRQHHRRGADAESQSWRHRASAPPARSTPARRSGVRFRMPGAQERYRRRRPRRVERPPRRHGHPVRDASTRPTRP